eukprot:TRINITY_DN2711_c1_g1_i1.p1 TRINITY_DN2711_c1_g1~~TRINITY_DN2711_c1_g1_i1.p1  ORF type:complete len:128 (-),score=5.67 TRINITY_DN2711_c1_g1_i1:633-1016(-)
MTTRAMGGQKMIGRDFIVGLSASPGQTSRDVYLPKGNWMNWLTNEIIKSNGQWYPCTHLYDFPAYCSQGSTCVFTLPSFVREGSIIPVKSVTNETMNNSFKTKSGTVDVDITYKVFVSEKKNFFCPI